MEAVIDNKKLIEYLLKKLPNGEPLRGYLEGGLDSQGLTVNNDGEIISKPEPKKPKFEEGDWIVDDNHNFLNIVKIKDGFYECIGTEDVGGRLTIYYVESIYHLWSIKDARDGDILSCTNGWTCIFKELRNHLFSSYCFMDNIGWFSYPGSVAHTTDERINGKIYPSTRVQRALFFQAMKLAGYGWNNKIKEVIRISI